MKFHFSGNLLRYVQFQSEIQVDGETIKQGIHNLVDKHPDFGRIILDVEGGVRMIHRFFLNGELLAAGDIDIQVEPGDEIIVLTPIAGG